MTPVYDPKQAEPDLPYLRKVVGASMAGTVVEWYEFFLYATVATLVFVPVVFSLVHRRDRAPRSESLPLTPGEQHVH